MKKKIITLQIFIVSFLTVDNSLLFAQTDTLHAIKPSASVGLVSRYIWRGQEYEHAPSIQPALSATWKHFTLGAWGAYKLTGPGIQETDFFLSKAIGPVTFTLGNYWSFCDTASMDFFNYNSKTTAHMLEAQLLFSGGENLPFTFLVSNFFYGADTSKSIYLELQYLYSSGSTDMMLYVGFQPKGKYYAPEADFVNIGCTVIKTLEVTDRWSLPVSLSLISNPNRKSIYLVAGITF
jgi:hypothetical protein